MRLGGTVCFLNASSAKHLGRSEKKEKKHLHGFGGCGLLEEVEGAVARDENPKRKTT